MQIHYSELKYAQEDIGQVTSALLCAKRDGEKPHSMEVKKLVKAIVNNKKNEGIVFKGDWSSQTMEFLEILKRLKPYNLKVTIYTEHSLEIFKSIIGIHSMEKVEKRRVEDAYLQDNLGEFELIGGMLIDYYIEEDYFVVCGKGDKRMVYRINKVVK